MQFAAICASHTPLMHEGEATPDDKSSVAAAFVCIRNFVDAFTPDLIVEFWPDHFNGFFYELMPPFCVGAHAESIGDWDTTARPLPVSTCDAEALTAYLLSRNVDVACSHRMRVDHGAVQIWEEMYGKDADLPAPILPIFVNCSAPPLPRYSRARTVGSTIGQWALETNRKVLFVGSGGLSHDPPTPDLSSAPSTVKERLIAGRNPTSDSLNARKQLVLEAGRAAAKNLPPCAPLNPAWDRHVLALFSQGQLEQFDDFDEKQVKRDAGRGGNEILTWLCALSALKATGAFQSKFQFYRPIPGWIAGMGMLACLSTPK